MSRTRSLRLRKVGVGGVSDEAAQSVGTEMALGNPANCLDIAKAAGGVFKVGLKVVFGIIVLVMAGDLLITFGNKKSFSWPKLVWPGNAQHVIAQCRLTNQGA